MSACTIVEVLIGLSFVYLLLSLICSAVNEFIAGILALRQRSLRRGIEVMVGKDKPKRGRTLVAQLRILEDTHSDGEIRAHAARVRAKL